VERPERPIRAHNPFLQLILAGDFEALELFGRIAIRMKG